MVILLWIVMLTFAVANWFVQRPGRPGWLRTTLALAHAVFLVWAIITSIELVGPAWLIVAVALGVLTLFGEDLRRLFGGRQ